MSRSFKHIPIVKMGGGKAEKRRANRSMRQKELPLGKSNLFKRFYNQYDVIDYRFYICEDNGMVKRCRRK